MSISRVWLFRGLVAIVAGLMVTSAIMPWWTCDIVPAGTGGAPTPITIEIYQYGLHHNLVELATYVAADETPFYQTVLAWVYLAVSIGLMLSSTWLKGRKGRWLLGGTGLIYVAYAAIAVIWIAIRTGEFGMPLQGHGSVTGVEGWAETYSGLQFGYYLAYAAGLICIALALLRDKIIGKPKLGV